MAKKKKSNSFKKNVSSLKTTVKQHKIVSILLILVLLFPASFFYEKYRDWDNAQMIKGLARDFPVLVSNIEQATGLELEIDSDCSTTSEKFSSGVKTCELSLAKQAKKELVEETIRRIRRSDIFSAVELSSNGYGYKVYYRNKYTCQLSNGETIFLSCVSAVRDANKKLAIEELSEIKK
ncbi:hypothetical protein KC959_03205 [Candidatus Saccharibacteria bacterium]|nr:hypothetical protein [Candidatus Saccharibacteria bacterium]